MKFFLPVTALLLLFSFSSCSTDFQLEADWEDIPVVYAFLSIQDTAHYIRVEKAFLEPGGDARAIAQIADSLYYDEDQISVRIEKTGTGQSYLLERVNGDAEGYPREAGVFAAAPNYLYKIRAEEIDLEGGERIRLVIDRGEDLDEVTAVTDMMGVVLPRNTSPGSPITFWPYIGNLNFSWSVADNDPSRIFDLRLFIHYLEVNPAAPDQPERKTLEWVVDREILRGSLSQDRFTVEVRGESFYKFIGDAIEPTVTRERIFEGFDIQVASAGQELVDLNRVMDANTGITSSQAIPVYTNLSEGRGIFTSRYVALREGLELKGEALDSLIGGIYTEALNFRRP